MSLNERIGSGLDPKERYPPDKPIKSFEVLRKDIERKNSPLEYLKLYLEWLSTTKDPPSSPLLELLVKSLIIFISNGENGVKIENETFDGSFLISDLREKDILFEKIEKNNWVLIFKKYPNNVAPFQILFKQIGIREKKVVPIKIEKINNPLFLKERFSFENFHDFIYRETRFYFHPAFRDGSLDSLDILFDWKEIESEPDKTVSIIRELANRTGWENANVKKVNPNTVLIETDEKRAKIERNIPNRRDEGFVTFSIDEREVADFLLVGTKVVNINLSKLDLEASPQEIKKGISNYPIPSIRKQIGEIFSNPKDRFQNLSRFMKAKDEFSAEAKKELRNKKSMTRALEGSKFSSKLERWSAIDKKMSDTIIGQKTLIFTMLLPFHLMWAFLFATISILGFLSFGAFHAQTQLYLRGISIFLFLWFFISASGKMFSYSNKYYVLSKISQLPSIVESHFLVVVMPIFLLFTLINFINPGLAPTIESQILILIVIFCLIPLTLKLRKDVESGFLFRGLYLSTLLIPTFLTLLSGWTLSAIYFIILLLILRLKDSKLLMLLERFSRGLSEDKLRLMASIILNMDEKEKTLSTEFSKGFIITCLREAGFSEDSKGEKFQFLSERSNKRVDLTIRKVNRLIGRENKLEFKIEEMEDDGKTKEEEVFLDSIIKIDSKKNGLGEVSLPDSSDPEEWNELIKKTREDKSRRSKIRSEIKNISNDKEDFTSLLRVLLNSKETRKKYRRFVDDFPKQQRGYKILGEKDGEEIFKQEKGDLGGYYLLSKIFDGEEILVYTGGGYFDVMLKRYNEFADEGKSFPYICEDGTSEDQVKQYYLQKDSK